ncbi:hypothetical protein [Actinoplanes subtropicus]|uniref:hypothetical protein n=1 Tax=Actinoplanes subtropicus TaxID=543632 RepID=UPI000A88EC0E|nr:hypothetical protein [Actinoplanes subtropicus]
MTSAPAVSDRLVRLLLLALTTLGIAALHTIGHATPTGPSHQAAPLGVSQAVSYDVSQAVSPAGTTVVAGAPIPDDRDGCDGDGCTHEAAMPAGTGDRSRWWDVCVAVLAVLALATLAPAMRCRGGESTTTASGRRRPAPHPVALPRLGLTLASDAVLRT